MPPPIVSAMKVNAPNIVYAGLNLTLQCDVALVRVTDTHVTVTIEWKKNGRRSSLRCPENQRLSQTEFRCTAEFTPLDYRSDNGTYICIYDNSHSYSTVLIPEDSDRSVRWHNSASSR